MKMSLMGGIREKKMSKEAPQGGNNEKKEVCETLR